MNKKRTSSQYAGCMKCENNPNCYFKQLKRAERKLEKVKDVIIRCRILQIIEGEENA